MVVSRRCPIAGAYDRDARRRRLPRPSCFRMRIVFLTGIWPPDVGGPATHGPDFAAFSRRARARGDVVTMGDGEPDVRPCEVNRRLARLAVSRSATVAVAARRGAAAARRPTSSTRPRRMRPRASPRRSARTPLVAKLVSDPATSARGATASSTARSRSSRRPAGGASRRSSARGRRRSQARGDRRPEHVPRRDRGRLGLDRAAARRAHEPGAGAADVEPEPLEPRAPSSSSAG